MCFEGRSRCLSALATLRLPLGEASPDGTPACDNQQEPDDESAPTAGECTNREEEDDRTHRDLDQGTFKELSHTAHVAKYGTVGSWDEGASLDVLLMSPVTVRYDIPYWVCSADLAPLGAVVLC